ncbi:NIPSNAP family protein [Alteribacillus sp. YIM 98480]|uniref:NIPSNAP family protein n=1 Tax=Alteribacillus sp. YIM 98480 TaxID=2606599 RepID=UPI00131D784C|nr:NIPSNAP family protein [Alteribacillus sp. YIM 98480]
MIYELREYIADENKEEALQKRFKNHVLSIFNKHSIEVVGFWREHNNPAKTMYLCRFNSLEEKEKAWDAFKKDPEWQRIKNESETEGALTKSMTSTLLEPVDFSSQP